MKHAPGFLKVVNDAKPSVAEVNVEEARQLLQANPEWTLLDVREDHEWEAEHAAEAQHLGKGILERDLEPLRRIQARINTAFAGFYLFLPCAALFSVHGD